MRIFAQIIKIMNKFIDIKSGTGLGELKFGMNREELKSLIGEPDEVEQYSLSGDEDDQTESWHYDELELALSFIKVDDWRLVSLTTSSEESVFKGTEMIGLSQKDLKTELKKIDVNDLEVEDCSSADTPNLKLVFSMIEGMNFWLEEGVVTDVEWGIRYNDDEQIDWPV
jgi:hypothetical protein